MAQHHKNDRNYKYEISIIFLIYNSSIERIRASLITALTQKDISFEVIIADDGSEDNHKEEIEAIFAEYNFKDYKLVFNEKNQGTVLNALSGLEISEGEYSKGLSPGDRLYSSNTLRDWINFMREGNYDWSFSEVVYYVVKNGKEKRIRFRAHPQYVEPYMLKLSNQCRWNYVVLLDVILGATAISKTEIKKTYFKKIQEKGIIYGEDTAWRILTFEGNVGGYYPHATIFYEYGNGVSTCKSDVWKKRLKRDGDIGSVFISEEQNIDDFQKKMIFYMKKNMKETNFIGRVINKLFISGKLRLWLKDKLNRRMTPIE